MANLKRLLSNRMQKMDVNIIREILKVVNQPGMISLAGGIPADESFPMDIFADLTDTVLSEFGTSALQYDVSEGFGPLRDALVDYLSEAKGVQTKLENILVFNGSQSGLDMIGKILLSPGDNVAIEAPSYLGAISAFNAYEPDYVQLETDDDGLIPDSLRRVLEIINIKFVYLVSTFQNPTGRTIPLGRRHEIAEIIKEHDALIIEDDPYGALRYSGEPLPPLQALAPDNVIYLSTFSKILAPGLRVGFCTVPQDLFRPLVMARQAADLHTNTFSQAIAAEYLRGGYLAQQLPKIIALYKPRRDAMLAALEAHMPAGYRWNRPDGGMFIWAQAPEGTDAEKLYWQCIEQKVAFVPGKYFYSDPKTQGLNTMRLNFTRADEATITRAIQTIGAVAANMAS
ncbi:MAG: PLP-dependent aminotransferase family protein [Ardenticatenales bacterium]|nr:PLP-dependent aminotransferase family protein [Ardenticatenales bacterium]